MNRLIKPAVLSISLLIIMTGTTVSPALGEISKAFPDIDSYLIKMILTLPTIVVIPFSLLSGKISLVMKNRKILIIALILYIIGGLGGSFTNSIYELLFFRVIIGMGMGLLIPLSRSLIADFFTGNERTEMMGMSNAISNLGGITATLIAGFLATFSWRYVFLVYLISLLVLVLVIFVLPEPKRRKPNNQNEFYINNKVLILAILAFFLNIAFYSVVTNIALFIENENIGNSNSAGIAMASLTLAGFISGIFLQKLSALLKNKKIPIGIVLMSSGFLLLSNAYNLTIILLANFLIGFGLGILKPLILLQVTKVTPQLSNAFSLSVVSSSLYFGKFMSPIFLNFLAEVFGNNSIRFTFFMVGIGLGLSFIISLILSFNSFRKQFSHLF
ncbi:MFS transporter [Thermohalobacter berrensis]|uniref:Major facilitator superfamily (MFS) profile domain-containing protein n=1 Tax=Thermohalobacter berrensis TaxID=99594 RepID=A0A419T7X3_9FIRM|nr:MFS transporter [Thermohalobacter berrensis]RKD33466.1 hypothetical protein BET03_09450 [Thermohalobacter berrensis]